MWYREVKTENYEGGFRFDEKHYENSFFRAVKPGCLTKTLPKFSTLSNFMFSQQFISLNSLDFSQSALFLTIHLSWSSNGSHFEQFSHSSQSSRRRQLLSVFWKIRRHLAHWQLVTSSVSYFLAFVVSSLFWAFEQPCGGKFWWFNGGKLNDILWMTSIGSI